MAPNTLAWLYWNPSREIFTIPWMNHPIAWYGFFFVLGFMLGYFIITPFFTQFLKESKTLSRLDIESWPRLLEYFQDRKPSSLAYQIWQRMNTSTQVQLKTLHSHSAIPLTMKNSILATFNTFWQHSSLQREELENDFKGAIAPVRQTGIFLVDRLCWFLVIGTLIGARLGAVFFYDWSYYQSHPMEIFKVWKVGLASHGLEYCLLFIFTIFISKNRSLILLF
jgi:phosphatidylglycerol---prolipoprotein diacylglyceryl transferase